jgi:hypothetical protein
MAKDEDWDTVMVVTAPVLGELGCPPAREDRACREHFIYQLSGWPRWPEELPFRCDSPVMQPFAAISKAVAGFIVRTSDVAVERHRHIEDGSSHL